MNEEIRRRYMNDPVFNHVVEMMVAALLRADITPHDLARAATLAATIYAERYGLPVMIVLIPDGDMRITTMADKIREEYSARVNGNPTYDR